MFPAETRFVDEDAYNSFVKTTLTNEYTFREPSLGRTAAAGSPYMKFRLAPNTEEDKEQLHITYVSTNATVTVNNEEAEQVEAGAIIQMAPSSDVQKAWYLPPDVVNEQSVLPVLRQAYCEGFHYEDREADFRYHFNDGETILAKPSPNPVSRLDEPLEFTAVEYLGGQFPQRWLLEADNGDYYFLRERSGSIRLIDDAGNGEEVFNAYVGREHPGMFLAQEEVLNIVTAVEYISIVDDPESEIPEEVHNEYWGDFGTLERAKEDEEKDLTPDVSHIVLDDDDEADDENQED